MPSVRPHILDTPHSGIRRMLELARDCPSPVMLVTGDPNFTTPTHIIDAAAAAARAGATGYSPGDGLPQLREALAAKLFERNGISASADQVCVTTGACGGLYTTLMMLLGHGDEILLPDPGWSNYAAMVHVLGATAVPYSLHPELGWRIDLDELERSITPHTQAILVNSPNNPTGSVESQETLERVVEIAQRHDLWVVSDEAYDELVFDARRVAPSILDVSDRVINVFSFSKTYAMTGWRIGYVVGPRPFIRQLSLHQEPVVSCASMISQHAALAALAGPQDCVHAMVDAYRRRRDLVAAELNEAKIPFVLPDGTFFLMIDIRGSGLDSWTFARELLQREQVGTVPGLAFGKRGEGFVRITVAASDEALVAGVAGLRNALSA